MIDLTMFKPYDTADYLSDEGRIEAYIEVTLEEGDAEDVLRTIETIARARARMKIAAATGLTWEELETALQPGSSDRMPILTKVLEAMDLSLPATPRDETSTAAE